MNKLQKQQYQFLRETAEYYNSKNRAIEKELNDFGSETCSYKATKTSPGCAIGRHLFSDIAKNIPNTVVDSDRIMYRLPKWMQELEAGFLRSVQKLHDKKEYWDYGGINSSGKHYVNEICQEFGLTKIYENE